MMEMGNFLASRASERQMAISASSSSALGLGIADIIKHGLVSQPAMNPAQEFAPPSSLAERVFHALAEAKIWTSRIAMRLDLVARDRYFRQLDLLHDCDEWFGDDQPLRLDSYKSFIRFMMSEASQSKPSLAMNPNGHLLAVWEVAASRLTIEFNGNDRLQWIVSCANGDRTAGMTSLASIKTHLAPYSPESFFGIG
jgi:hypothetical protein